MIPGIHADNSPSFIQRAFHANSRLFDHVQINLGCRNIGMSQQILYSADIRSLLQQVGGKTVPQGMRCDPFVQFGFSRRLPDRMLKCRVQNMMPSRQPGALINR